MSKLVLLAVTLLATICLTFAALALSVRVASVLFGHVEYRIDQQRASNGLCYGLIFRQSAEGGAAYVT